MLISKFIFQLSTLNKHNQNIFERKDIKIDGFVESYHLKDAKIYSKPNSKCNVRF